ncbi:uncharacterized protein LOC135164734 [Diachasmimorpha longicaudata]|uniref:uncharacterized protein LOC135164734 n=1 Tax=Diachasmimorpha longicaudata TaxID=58733 RepID=UPI0030B87673
MAMKRGNSKGIRMMRNLANGIMFKMRFYAVLAALAFVFINCAEANNAANLVEDSITNTKRILQEYKLHLKDIQRYFIDLYQFRKENASIVADSSVQELQPQFEDASGLGKDTDKCLKALNVVVQHALNIHMDTTRLCEDANLPNFIAYRRQVDELLKEGDGFESQIQMNIDNCKNETDYDGCLTLGADLLNTSAVNWATRVTNMRLKEAADTIEAKKQIPLCVNSSFTRFAMQLRTVNGIARSCLNSLMETTN